MDARSLHVNDLLVLGRVRSVDLDAALASGVGTDRGGQAMLEKVAESPWMPPLLWLATVVIGMFVNAWYWETDA